LYRSCLSIINSKHGKRSAYYLIRLTRTIEKFHARFPQNVCTTRFVVYTQDRRIAIYTKSSDCCVHKIVLSFTHRHSSLQAAVACVIIYCVIEIHSQLVSRENAIVFYGSLKIIFEYRRIVIFYTHFHTKELSILINSNITCPLFYRIART